MNGILSKIAMLAMFLLAVTCAWAAWTMVFHVTLFNILLGILAAFFLLRAFELADKINKLGPYAEDDDARNRPDRRDPRFGGERPDDQDGPEN